MWAWVAGWLCRLCSELNHVRRMWVFSSGLEENSGGPIGTLQHSLPVVAGRWARAFPSCRYAAAHWRVLKPELVTVSAVRAPWQLHAARQHWEISSRTHVRDKPLLVLVLYSTNTAALMGASYKGPARRDGYCTVPPLPPLICLSYHTMHHRFQGLKTPELISEMRMVQESADVYGYASYLLALPRSPSSVHLRMRCVARKSAP